MRSGGNSQSQVVRVSFSVRWPSKKASGMGKSMRKEQKRQNNSAAAAPPPLKFDPTLSTPCPPLSTPRLCAT